MRELYVIATLFLDAQGEFARNLNYPPVVSQTPCNTIVRENRVTGGTRIDVCLKLHREHREPPALLADVVR